MGSDFQESPFMLPVLPEPAELAGFSPASSLASDSVLALELALALSLLPAVLPLSERSSPVLALLASFMGTFRRVITMPVSGRSRHYAHRRKNRQHLFDAPPEPPGTLGPCLVPNDGDAKVLGYALQLLV
jgi:hypothetical protein